MLVSVRVHQTLVKKTKKKIFDKFKETEVMYQSNEC